MMSWCKIDGRRVHFLDEGSGEPVLLLHGYPQSSLCWRHQMPALAARYRVVAPDWPGFGRSEPPASAATYDAEVARIEQLVQVFGLEQFNLVAHDYGGFLGLGYVLRHPQRVLRLALLNTRGHGIFRPWFYRFTVGQCWTASHLPGVFRRLPLRHIHHHALRRYRKLGCFDTTLENDYLGWMDDSTGRQTFVDFFAHYHVPRIPELAAGLSEIGCPTAVIWGDRDPYIPFETARELADRIPDVTLTRLRGGDHYIMEERPDEVTLALLDLLACSPTRHQRLTPC
jgi:pimeloyl-ACP methyl ester carboxylesterase